MRERMARLLSELRSEGINDPGVLAAMERVPRERFVPPESRALAFHNIPLPIGEGQTISQPYVVALMTQSLRLTGCETVLEVGTGSGYQCAILAELCGRVVTIERIDHLAKSCRARLAALGYTNVQVLVGDGSLGWPPGAPYDAIVVTAACHSLPQPLAEQLAEGGRIVLPVGSHYSQELVLYVKRHEKLLPHRLGAVRFVPLIGQAGWEERDAPNPYLGPQSMWGSGEITS